MTVVAGRYRLLTRIGEGGMGVVWRAHDELLRRDIAVKELHVRIGVDSDFHIRQVLREARAAAQLRHPGVVAVHDVVVDDGRPLILMELVEGQSLSELVLSQGPLPEERVAEIGARVLEALSIAHARGVVHRDVKPANILLAGDRVVLTDFGIAAIASETTVSNGMIGSLDFMAPERITGKPVTPASDLWSLGVTLCAAVRGESPFQRSDTQATLAAVLTHEPTPIPHAPRLWRVLEMLLHKDPRQRPTATAASAMLASIANGSNASIPIANGSNANIPIANIPRTPFNAVGGAMVEPAMERMPEPVRARTGEPATQRTGDPNSNSGPVVDALTDSTGSRLRNYRARRRRLAVLVTVLVLVVAGGIWLVVRPVGDVAGTATGARTAAAAVPSGFTSHRGAGFTIAIPKGWFKDPSDQEIYWVSNPHSQNLVLGHVEWWDDTAPGGARAVLTDLERGEFLEVKYISKYKRLKLVELPAPRNTSRAELEVTYHVNDGGPLDLHERIRAIVTPSGRTYVVSVAAQGATRAVEQRLWRTEQKDLVAIQESFRVTS